MEDDFVLLDFNLIFVTIFKPLVDAAIFTAEERLGSLPQLRRALEVAREKI